MRITGLPVVIIIFFLAAPAAWSAGREGAVEGTLTPPDATASREGAIAVKGQVEVVATEGADWNAGTVRAAGIGSPPKSAANPAQARAMTQRAAVADAQRNLLRIIEQIKVDGGRTVGSLMRSRNGTERLEGYLQGYTIVSERDLGDGRIEVVIELPLTGPRGLSSFLAE